MTGRGAFTHMSMYQVRISASDVRLFNGLRALPQVTFTAVGRVDGRPSRRPLDQPTSGSRYRHCEVELPRTLSAP